MLVMSKYPRSIQEFRVFTRGVQDRTRVVSFYSKKITFIHVSDINYVMSDMLISLIYHKNILFLKKSNEAIGHGMK